MLESGNFYTRINDQILKKHCYFGLKMSINTVMIFSNLKKGYCGCYFPNLREWNLGLTWNIPQFWYKINSVG